MYDNALCIPELMSPSSVVVLGYSNNCTWHFYQEHSGQFGHFLSLSVHNIFRFVVWDFFKKTSSHSAISQNLFFMVTLGTPGLSQCHSVASWWHKTGCSAGTACATAATFSSDSLGLMSWWSSPDITSPSLGTVQTKVPLVETGTVAWITDREIPLWVTFLFNQQLPSCIRIFI